MSPRDGGRLAGEATDLWVWQQVLAKHASWASLCPHPPLLGPPRSLLLPASLKGPDWTPRHQGPLKCFFFGSFWSQERLYEAGGAINPECLA
eukprot:3107352-Pyramimonas_sp.AAC.1